LLLACATVGGVRANAESHAEPAHAETAQAEPAHAEPAHAQPAEVSPEKAHGAAPAKAIAGHEDDSAHAEPNASSSAEEGEKKVKTIEPHAAKGASLKAGNSHEEATALEFASLLKLGNRLTDRGDYDSAEIAYRQILSAPNAPVMETKSALLGLAHMFRKQGTNLTKAAAIYEKYLKEYPGDDRSPECLLELGRTLRSMGAYKLAIARFYNVINSTLKVSGEGFDRYQLLARTAQFEIAETHLESGNYAEASKFFTRLRLLELAPIDRARAHFKAAYAMHMTGDLDAAVQALRSYLEQWPNDENTAEARYWLAVDLRATKRGGEAMAVTLDLLKAQKERMAGDPKLWLYWQRRTGNQLANDFFETGDITNAQAIYSGLAALSPEPMWKLPLTYQIGLCRERLGDPVGARTAYQSIIDAAGATPPADLAEVVRMAAWRMGQITWREDTTHQISAFFDNNTGRMTTNTAAAATPATTTPATGAAPEPAKTATP
jgi:TolA-binding protein